MFKQFVQSLEKDYEGFEDSASLLKNLSVVYSAVIIMSIPLLICDDISEISIRL